MIKNRQSKGYKNYEFPSPNNTALEIIWGYFNPILKETIDPTGRKLLSIQKIWTTESLRVI